MNGWQRVLCLFVLMLCGILRASQTVATNEHVVTVVNVNGVSQDRAELVERIARIESSYDSLRTNVDGWMRVTESRAEREAKKEDKIESRLDKACACAEKFYEKRYGELKEANDRFSEYADGWMTIMGWIVGAASLMATIISFVFGCVLPRIDMHGRNKQLSAMAERMVKMEEEAVAERAAWKVEARVQKRWTLALIIRSVDMMAVTTPIDRQRLVDDLACFMLQFYQLIDGCVRDGNADAVEEEVSHCAPFLKRWLEVSDPNFMNIFNTACIGVRKKVRPDRVVYETLFRGNGESFALLEKLFVRIGVWKVNNA